MSETCPKCRSEEIPPAPGVVATCFRCGSYTFDLDRGLDLESERCLKNQLAQRDAKIAELEARYIRAVMALWMGTEEEGTEVIHDYEENFCATDPNSRKRVRGE